MKKTLSRLRPRRKCLSVTAQYMLGAEPANPANPVEPMEPVEPANPAKPMEPVEPVEPPPAKQVPTGPKRRFVCTKPLVTVEVGKVGQPPGVVVVPCNTEFTSRQALSNHASSTRGFSGHGSRTCRYCLKALKTEQQQNLHEAKCFPPRCVICNRELSSPAVLEIHMRQTHSDIISKLRSLRVMWAPVSVRNGRSSPMTHPMVSCPDCGAMVQRRCLNRHLRSSCKFQNEDGSVFTKMCSCGRGFQIRRFYKHHIRTSCAADRPPIALPETIFKHTDSST